LYNISKETTVNLEKIKSIDLFVWMFVTRQFAEYINKKEELYNGPYDWKKFPENMKDRILFRIVNFSVDVLSSDQEEVKKEIEYAKHLAETVAKELVSTAGLIK
jgi:hypothetical protein